MNNEYPPPKKHYIFRIQRTRQYLRFKFWKFNIYLTLRPLSVRQNGLERGNLKKKRYKMKERLLNERGFCQHCGKPLDWENASVHHIIPKSVDRSKEFDPSNLMLLCNECHTRHHQIEQLKAKMA